MDNKCCFCGKDHSALTEIEEHKSVCQACKDLILAAYRLFLKGDSI